MRRMLRPRQYGYHVRCPGRPDNSKTRREDVQRTRIILFFIGFFLSFGVAAQELDFNLSNEAFLVRYKPTPTAAGMQVDFGLMHQEDDVDIGSIGLHLVDNAGTAAQAFRVGLGGRLFALDADGGSGGMLAIGAWGRYTFPQADRFALMGSIHFAPSVTAFGDVEQFIEYGVRGEYEVLRNGSLYVGYRRLRADFDFADDVDLDEGLHLGMRFTF